MFNIAEVDFYGNTDMTIRMIVGLGNPGPEYELTRHNVGWWFIDNLDGSARWNKEAKFQALVAKARIGNEDVMLVKPQTIMNRSGLSVGLIAKFFKMNAEEILVVHDELDIHPGQAKLKRSGSTGGHNGLKDIVNALGTQNFWRLRFGIGHPRDVNAHIPVIDYVLGRPPHDDLNKIEEAIRRAIILMPTICDGQMEKAMMTLHSGN